MRPECRVLVVTPGYSPEQGGIQNLATGLVKHRRKVAYRVVTKRRLSSDRPTDDGDVVRVPVTHVPWRPAGNALLGFAALAEAGRFRPDVVLNLHLVTSPWVTVIRRLSRVPVVLYLHGSEVVRRPWLTRLAISEADAVVCISHFTEELANRVARPRNGVVIPAGVDPFGDPGEPVSQRPGPPTILTVTRLAERYKGLDVLLRAIPLVRARVPDARWVVIGDGPSRGWLSRATRSSGLDDAVAILGHQPDHVREEWMRRAHVFALPGRLAADDSGEGFGIVFLEAGARRLPVVAGNAGGARESVLDGRTGRLVDPLDHVAVAETISSLLLDPLDADRLGDEGRRHAEALSWSVIAGQLEDLLLDVASMPPRS